MAMSRYRDAQLPSPAIATDAVGHRDAPKRTKDPKRFAKRL
jgi:hypothetical protein